jgi:hypothetical protein
VHTKGTPQPASTAISACVTWLGLHRENGYDDFTELSAAVITNRKPFFIRQIPPNPYLHCPGRLSRHRDETLTLSMMSWFAPAME